MKDDLYKSKVTGIVKTLKEWQDNFKWINEHLVEEHTKFDIPTEENPTGLTKV